MPRKRQRNRGVPSVAGHKSGDSGLRAPDDSRDTASIDQRVRKAVAEYTIEVTEVQAESFAGPLPHPVHLAGYESVLPGAADRILRMAEQHAEHRRRIESEVVESQIKFEARGQWLAFTIATIIVAGGIYLIAEDKSVEGVAAIISTVAVLAGVFIYGKRQKQQESSNKAGRGITSATQPDPPSLPGRTDRK